MCRNRSKYIKKQYLISLAFSYLLWHSGFVSPHTYRHTITTQSTTHFPSLVSSKKAALQEFINKMSSSLKAVPHLYKKMDFSYHPVIAAVSWLATDSYLYSGCQSCRKNIGSGEKFRPSGH